MPRPRVHDPDAVLDAVESLAAEAGPAAVTIRGVASAVGISNGAIYHTFSSRAELLGRAWLRAARRFLALQNTLVEESLPDPADAVVAAAEAPVVFAERFPASCALVFAVTPEQLLGDEIPAGLAAEIDEQQYALIELMVRLSTAMWDRKDARAVDVITTCIVDLPTSILLHRNRIKKPLAREHLRAAVRAILEIGPPPTTRTPRRRNR
jgi:AcrR family transcriptional regulator